MLRHLETAKRFAELLPVLEIVDGLFTHCRHGAGRFGGVGQCAAVERRINQGLGLAAWFEQQRVRTAPNVLERKRCTLTSVQRGCRGARQSRRVGSECKHRERS